MTEEITKDISGDTLEKVKQVEEQSVEKKKVDNTKKSGWPIPQEWLFSEKFNGMVMDLMPKNDDLVKWSSLRKTIEDKKFKKENIKKLYSIFSFLCIKNKFKLSF